MELIIYGDFNCPYSYLASQRADRLAGVDVRVDWRAVEHDDSLAVTGTSSAPRVSEWERELGEVAGLALPGEHVPAAPPSVISNTGAAVAAYAEAVSDGIQDQLRNGLFDAIWVQGRHLSHAFDVRPVIRELMWSAGPMAPRLSSPELAGRLDHDKDLNRIVRRSGGTIAQDGGPLTTAGYRRIHHWRTEWLGQPSHVVPLLLAHDGTVHPGVGALRYLASLLPADGASVPGPAEEPGLRSRPGARASEPASAGEPDLRAWPDASAA